MALADLIEVSKKFGANEILNGVNFSVNELERIAIIGKSVLMKLLCAQIEPAFKTALKLKCLRKILNLTM